MKRNTITKFVDTLWKNTKKHSPELLTGFGLAGTVTAAGLTIRATIKAVRDIDEKKKETKDKLSKMDVVKVAGKHYILPGTVLIVSDAMIFAGQKVSLDRVGKLFTAYKISETTVRELKDSMEEVLKDKDIQKVKQKVAEKKIEDVTGKKSDGNVIFVPSDDEVWFVDGFSNYKFKATKNEIEAAANRISRQLLNDMTVSLSEFYDELNIPHTFDSDDKGWTVDKSIVEVDLSDAIVIDGKPYIVVDFLTRPDILPSRIYY